MSTSVLASRLRVGIFMVASVALLVAGVFLLGRSHSLFSRKVTLYASFENTNGLVVGAPVQLAGVDVGIVRDIQFFADPSIKLVKVTLAVERAWLERIRADSIAQLGSKGMLGDMLVNLTIGGAEADAHEDGDTLLSQEAAGLAQVIAAVEAAVGKVKTLTSEVDRRVREVLTEKLAKDIGRIAAAAANAVEHVESGDGLAHALIYDKRLARDAMDGVHYFRQAATHVEGSVSEVEALLAEVKNGDGVLHALIYEEGGAKTVRALERVAKELGDAVAEIKTGNGLIHSLIYEKDRTNLLQDLAHTAKILRDVADEVAQGKGTIGGLLKDPTVYQDLTTVLGDIKRNVLLKAMLRFAIKNDGLARAGTIDEPAQSAHAEP